MRELVGGKAGRRLRTGVVVLLATAVVNALIYGFIVSPAARRLDAGERSVAELKRQYAEALLFKKQKKALSGLNDGILMQKDVPLLLKDLVQMARRRGLKADTINSDIPTPSAGGLTLLAFTVPLTGTYANCKRYIHDLETADRLVGIQGIRFSSEKKSTKVDMELKLITYIRGA